MDAVIWTLALVAYGSLVAAVVGIQLRLFKNATADRQPVDAGARRRLVHASVGVGVFIVFEVVAWFLGSALGGPALGGALVAAGLVMGLVVGFVSAVRVDQREGRLG
jgi:hypothetical protein